MVGDTQHRHRQQEQKQAGLGGHRIRHHQAAGKGAHSSQNRKHRPLPAAHGPAGGHRQKSTDDHHGPVANPLSPEGNHVPAVGIMPEFGDPVGRHPGLFQQDGKPFHILKEPVNTQNGDQPQNPAAVAEPVAKRCRRGAAEADHQNFMGIFHRQAQTRHHTAHGCGGQAGGQEDAHQAVDIFFTVHPGHLPHGSARMPGKSCPAQSLPWQEPNPAGYR